MTEIFISYRRQDSSAMARRLAEALARAFGPGAVFIDTDTIRSGQNWKHEIDKALAESSVIIAVIGARWLFLQDAYGRRRIDAPDDWVRTEICAGNEKNLLPVLVSGASIPQREALPDPLVSLSDTQAYKIDDEFWERDTSYLVKRLENLGIKRRDADLAATNWVLPPPIDTSKELTDSELQDAMNGLPGWVVVHRPLPDKPDQSKAELHKTFKFRSFEDAIHFMSTATRFISTMGHHPDWENVWVSVGVWLTTWPGFPFWHPGWHPG